jgi:hypothetical protein
MAQKTVSAHFLDAIWDSDFRHIPKNQFGAPGCGIQNELSRDDKVRVLRSNRNVEQIHVVKCPWTNLAKPRWKTN